MYQQIHILGYIGRDPEMRYLPNGDPVLAFSVAASRRWIGNDGEKHEETAWFRVSFFGKTAEKVYSFLKKGDLVFLVGRLNADPKTGGPRLYKRSDGTIGTSFEIIAQELKVLSKKSGENGNGESIEENEPQIDMNDIKPLSDADEDIF